MPPFSHTLIVGAGAGLSAAFAREMRKRGSAISLAARDVAKLADLAGELDAGVFDCDAAQTRSVAALFEAVDASEPGAPDLVLFNPSRRVRGSILDLDPEEARDAIELTGFGGFLVAQQAARRMLARGRGAIAFTGASAGVKGYPNSSVFAMGKFALRGLCQSLARELHPKGIRILHTVVDGAIRSERRVEPADAPDSFLDPDAIARTMADLLEQPRNCWTWEIELRPWVETF